MDSQGDLVRVLVVDDDPAVRDMLSRAMTREGHVVLALGSAEEALSALPDWTFDAALLDQLLPGMDGILLGEYLRKNNPTMQIALMTGDETKNLERHAKKLGIAFIKKPFDLPRVLDVVDSAKRAVSSRRLRANAVASEDFAPAFGHFMSELAEQYRLPHPPRRLEEALVEGIKHHLSQLKHDRHYDERSRVAALTGLLAATLLGVDLPHAESDKTLYEEYDELMAKRGKRTEFGPG
ncbi:MAG TPA: response regulator [Polyangiaceae bacterium]|jgi:CheY-like chemotaxis protein|nr:response regulator [Polyangiaceae bacterium]